MHSQYTLYRRKTTKRNPFVYYVRFRDPETGERLRGLSTGCTSKAAANNWAIDYLASGKLMTKGNMRFRDFARDWFIWGKCRYVKMQLAKGVSISMAYAEQSRSNLDNHILPVFGNVQIDHITVEMLERFLLTLIAPDLARKAALSSQTANNIFQVLRTMLKEAHRKGWITSNPAAKVSPLAAHNREHGVFSLEELKQLFSMEAYSSVWNGSTLHFAINLLAASTGMRQGEVQALKIGDFHEDYVEVRHTWARKHGLKPPKYGSRRFVPIPTMTSSWINRLLEVHTAKDNPDAFLFYSSSPTVPVDHKIINKYFGRALRCAQIGSDEGRTRFLTFHSWRHTLNTLLRNRVPDNKLRTLTGHRTEQMTDHYTHFQIGDYQDVVDEQNLFFPVA